MLRNQLLSFRLAMQPWHRTLFVMFIAQMASSIGFSIIFPFFPLYVKDLGSSTGTSIELLAGLVFSAQALTMMVASPLWGAVADRHGRKLMVERASFGGMLIIAMMAFVGSAEELVALRAIQGFITGTVSAVNALVAAAAPRDRTGFAMGTVQVALWGGVAMGPLIGGILADTYGYGMPFLVTAVLLGCAGLLVHFFVHEDFSPEVRAANRSHGFIAEWKHILKMPGVVQTYVIRFMAGLGRSMIVPITPLFVAVLLAGNVERLPLPTAFENLVPDIAGISTYTGLVVGIASAASTFSGVYLGRLGDRIGHRKVLLVSTTMSVIFYIPQAFVSSAGQLLILQALTGFAAGGVVAAPSALLARYTEPGEEGSVYGMDNSVVAGARAIAPLVGAGVAAVFGLRVTFAAVSLLFAVMTVVTFMVLPKYDPVQLRQMEIRAQQEETQSNPEPQPVS